MKKIMNYPFCLFFLLPLTILVFPGCQKLDDRLSDMEDGISVVGNPSTVLIGDSVTVVGRLHLDRSPTVSLGGVPATYEAITPENSANYGDLAYPIEALRFEVTAEMGHGRQPLEVRSGDQFQVLYVTLLTQPEFTGSRPDTTLVVEELFDGNIPGFSERYADAAAAPSQSNTYFPGRSVTADGTIYLQSSRDIYRFRDGQLETLLKTGDPLMIDGQELRIKEYITDNNTPTGDSFSGMAVSADNSTMYLSVYTEVIGEDDKTGAWLLLRTDPLLSSFEVLNRTVHQHAVDSVWLEFDWHPDGGIWLVNNNNTYAPDQVLDNGPIANTQMMAQNLFLDTRQQLLFTNGTYSARLEPNGRIAKFTDGGTISYLPDGSKCFIIDQMGFTLFDLELMEPVANVPQSYANWNYLSFEENPDWQFPEKTGTVQTTGSFMALPNGELLCIPNTSQRLSIGSINPETATLYAFAGIERGFVGESLPGGGSLFDIQYQETGQAKYVNFANYLRNEEFLGNCTFIGMDSRNNIYYMRGGEQRRVAGRNMPMPPKIYRLGRPSGETETPAENQL